MSKSSKCFDCGHYNIYLLKLLLNLLLHIGSKPCNWASVSYGIFLCLNCCGIHRSKPELGLND